jgi:hypothetical protein
MKTRKLLPKSVLLIYLLAITALSGCEKENIDPAKFKTDLLIGDWQMIEKDGASYPAPNTTFILTYESSGSAQSCSTGDSNPLNNGCDDYSWQWEDNNQSSIIMKIDTDEAKFDLTLLDETTLAYTINYEPNTTSYKFTRVQ